MKTITAFSLFISGIILLSMQTGAATWFVSPSGNDAAAGTMEQPFVSWVKAQSAAAAGDTVYFRGGTWTYTKAANNCSSQTSLTSVIILNKSGSSGKLIHYLAYPGEKPVFDFYGVTDDCRIRAFEVSASWIHMKGLEIQGLPQNNNLNHENWGVHVFGSNNIFEQLDIHNIMGAGLFIQQGEGNLVLNCDSHDNYDLYTSNGAGESADGFGCHTTTAGTVGNVFRGCRAWSNADDGYDCINCDQPVLFENCWAFLNGYKPGTSSAAGNGNGFKAGGFGLPPTGYPATIPRHTARNCLSFYNRVAGFYQNHHPVSNYYYNNTGYKNGVNFNMLGYDLNAGADAGMGIYRNNVAYAGTAVSNAAGADASYNTWDLSSITVSDADFQSVDTSGVRGPRKADGGLPDCAFMHLAAGSDMIDKGIIVGLPYAGQAPDLGAFEFGGAPVSINQRGPKTLYTGIGDIAAADKFHLFDLSGRIRTTAGMRHSTGIHIYILSPAKGGSCRYATINRE